MQNYLHAYGINKESISIHSIPWKLNTYLANNGTKTQLSYMQ